MQLSPNEARDALEVVATTEQRAMRFRSYRLTSPHTILWGAIWMVGYTLNGIEPVRWAGLTWIPLVALGVLAGVAIDRPASGLSRPSRTYAYAWVPALAFYFAVIIVMQPTRLVQFEIFPALCCALLYAYFGVFRAPAFGWLGSALFVLSLGGYFLLRQPLVSFWMALCGGGTLLVSGFWLGRK